MVDYHWCLRWLLRLAGGMMLLAVGAVFMPRAWMVVTADWVGLGPLPTGPLVEYLARTLSAMYAVMGGLLIALSRDVRRYAGIVAYSAWAMVITGLLALVLFPLMGMPWYWTAADPPSAMGFGLAALWLLRRARPVGPG